MEEEVPNIPISIDLNKILHEILQFIAELSGGVQLLITHYPDIYSRKLSPVEWSLDASDATISLMETRKLLEILSLKKHSESGTSSQEKFPEGFVLTGWGYTDDQPLLGFAILRESSFSKSEITYLSSIFARCGTIFYKSVKMLRYLEETARVIHRQGRAIEVLYGVTNAVAKGTSADRLAEEGIQALCQASGADAGVCYLYGGKESERKSRAGNGISSELKLIASYGLDQDTQKKYFLRPCPPMFSLVAQSKDPVILPQLRASDDDHWWMIPETKTGVCLLVPIKVASGESLGVLALLHKEEKLIDSSYVTLAVAAASQIGIAALQSVLVQESQKQARSISALYRLSHELSSFLTMEEVFQRAFEIMKEELSIDRFWLGLLNETSTRLIGQAAYGPGWKKKLIEINVDITEASNPLSEVIRKKQAVILDAIDDGIPGIGLKRFMIRNDIHAVGIVPLVAGGQVLGVLAFEARREEAELSLEDLSLLSSFGAEIANVLLAKRLEERVAAGETMRAAGLLAAGIAHNFNNVLQGILGQASLIELYAEKPDQIKKSSRIISDAATKGASLVRQLLSFAHLEEPAPELIDTASLIEQHKTTFQRLLKDKQYIRYEIDDKIVRAYADPRQVVRILQSLLSNASEAMDQEGCVEILIDEVIVDSSTPHYEVPYGKYIRIGVRDNGIGMDSETKKRCFEPFFTTRNVDQSTGLSLSGEGMGLSAAYALARKNGGRLVVDSRKGYGSLFTLYLLVDPSLRIDSEEIKATNQENAIASQIEVEGEANSAEGIFSAVRELSSDLTDISGKNK
jgi:signal transduction histidine kinase